jgi:hypothetical protein
LSGPESCTLKRELLNEYSIAVSKHLDSLADAQRVFDKPIEYRKAYLSAKCTWTLAELARLIYQRHVKTHRC